MGTRSKHTRERLAQLEREARGLRAWPGTLCPELPRPSRRRLQLVALAVLALAVLPWGLGLVALVAWLAS